MANGPYADYSYYSSQYYGSTIPPGEFMRLAARASEYIDYITFGRAREHSNDDEVKRATCAVAEGLHKQEQGGEVTMRTVGPWTEQYAASEYAAARSPARKLKAIAARYLGGTGLMYRGC